MYICEICNQSTPAGINARRVVVETRKREYPRRKLVHPIPNRKNKYKDDPGGVGKEIVKEIWVCPKCETEQEAVEEPAIQGSTVG